MRKNKLLLGVAAICMVVGSAAAALPPGYVWGIANCGPAVNDSAGTCHLCCAGGQRNGSINATERDGCDQMCDESNFTRQTFWQMFWKGYRPFNFR